MTRMISKLARPLLIGALIAGLGAQPAFAQDNVVSAAKAAGTVGEQADGFVGFRVPSSDAALTQAVQVTNAARREAYARSAASAGTTADIAGARMFESQLRPRISSGEWYRNAQGQWVQR